MRTNLSDSALGLHMALTRTRNAKVCAQILKALLFRRQALKESDELNMDPLTYVWDGEAMSRNFPEAKTRRRVESLIRNAGGLVNKKDVSVLCAYAIKCRKALRST